MNVYIIRHGETESNKNKVHQYPDTPLSLLGKQQAEEIAEKLLSANITKIYSSDLIRATDTAKIISEKIKTNLSLMPEIREIKKPSQIWGKNHGDKEILKIKEQIDKNYHLKDWHYSDEENFFDVKERTKKFINYLKTLKETENVLVVTHGYIAKMFLALVIFDEKLTPEVYLKIYQNVRISNVSISNFIYSNNKWELVYWNRPLSIFNG